MHHNEQADDEEDRDEDEEYPDDGSVDTDPCPVCGKPVYEQAERCPHCGSYILEEDSTKRQPLWIIVGTLLMLAGIIVVWVIMGR